MTTPELSDDETAYLALIDAAPYPPEVRAAALHATLERTFDRLAHARGNRREEPQP